MIDWLIGWLVDCCYWSAKVFVLGLFIAAFGAVLNDRVVSLFFGRVGVSL